MLTPLEKRESEFEMPGMHHLLTIAIVGLTLAVVGCGPRHHYSEYPAASHSTHDAELFNDRGNGYVLKHEFKLAVHNYTEAIKLDRNYADAYGNRGSVYLQVGNPDLAITDLDEAIRLKPDFGRAFYLRGEAWQLKGDAKQAKDDFAHAKELGFDPQTKL